MLLFLLSTNDRVVCQSLQDFSFVMREFRMFFIKLPNGVLHRQIFSISKPLSELKDRLCDVLGVGA